MAKQNKYAEKAAVLDAIRSGVLDEVTTTVEHNCLDKLLSNRLYTPSHFLYWYGAFLKEFNSGISKRGRVRSAATKSVGARRFIEFVKYIQSKELDVVSPAEIRAVDIEAFLARWNQSPRTKKAHFSDIRQLFNWLLKQQTSGVKFNVMHSLEVPHYVVKKTERITDEKLLSRLFLMIQKVPRRGDKDDAERQRALDLAILSLAISTASRRTAISSVRLSRINWNESTVNYDDKGKLGIVSPINDCKAYLLAYSKLRKLHGQRAGESQAQYLTRCATYNKTWLDRQVDAENPEADDFFFRRHDGFPCTAEFISSTFDRWSKWLSDSKNGFVIKLRPHQIRKYRGILAYKETHDLNLVMNLMGHSSINMTLDYLEISTDERMQFMKSTSPLAAIMQR